MNMIKKLKNFKISKNTKFKLIKIYATIINIIVLIKSILILNKNICISNLTLSDAYITIIATVLIGNTFYDWAFKK